MRVPGSSRRRGPQWRCKRVGGPTTHEATRWPGLVPALRLLWGARQAGRRLAPALFGDVFVCERQHYLSICATHPGCREGVPARCFSTKFCFRLAAWQNSHMVAVCVAACAAGPAPGCRAAE